MSSNYACHGDESRQRDQICTIGRSLFERGLATGSSGNISVRLDDGWLVTPTNSSLGSLDPARLSRLDHKRTLVTGDQPSKETFLHLAMYEERPRARAIVHLHSTYSAAVFCMDGLDCDNCIPPLTAYYAMKIGRLPLVPYFRPGDPKLAKAVGRLSCRHCAVLLANHGPVVSGASLVSATNAIEELEETAKLYLLLRGTPTKPISEVEIAELTETFGSPGD
jgi:ribulose-5-phosphate 4-epimerase/fuculose-1-phosphate aldolase